jgi:hypothetical protein
MDYASCGKMFTIGQSIRMRTAAESSTASRSNLWSTGNLAFTGVLNTGPGTCAPTVAFAVPNGRICPGGSVTVAPNITNATVDTSLHIIWRCPGGTPAVSTLLNPTITYVTEGRYSIDFIAYNASGRDSIRGTNVVFVTANQAAYVPLDAEGFEGSTFPQVGSNLYNEWVLEGGATGWTASTMAAQSGTKALRIFSGSQTGGTPVGVNSPRYDLSTATGPIYLTYKYAAARRIASNTDVFKIYTSVNCGQTFTFRVQRTGTTGAYAAYTTASTFSGSFRPQAADWRTERILLPNMAGQPDVRFRFELIPGGGSNFYIDSVLVDGATDVKAGLASRFSIAPNPASDVCEVTLPGSGTYTYQMVDVLGQTVRQGNGVGTTFNVSVGQLPAGAYMITVQQNGNSYQNRVLVQPSGTGR